VGQYLDAVAKRAETEMVADPGRSERIWRGVIPWYQDTVNYGSLPHHLRSNWDIQKYGMSPFTFLLLAVSLGQRRVSHLES